LLITLQKQLEGAGGCFVLCNVAPAVHEVFETTRLIHLLNICVQDPAAEPGSLEAGLRLLRSAAERCAAASQPKLVPGHAPTAPPPTPHAEDILSPRTKVTPTSTPLAG